MNIDLYKYVSDRKIERGGTNKEPGPVITLSREYGCTARIIADKLTVELNRKAFARGKEDQWKYVTKEIMAESARALEVDPDKIKYVFDYEHKGILDEVISAQFNKYYKSDRKIRNTIAKVIRNMAHEGHVIIVGRAGVAITRDIPRSLHIMLEAPLEWRAARIAENFHINLHDARKAAVETDKKRQEFREFFRGKGTDYTKYDVTFNCMTLSQDEIVQTILKMLDLRKMI